MMVNSDRIRNISLQTLKGDAAIAKHVGWYEQSHLTALGNVSLTSNKKRMPPETTKALTKFIEYRQAIPSFGDSKHPDRSFYSIETAI